MAQLLRIGRFAYVVAWRFYRDRGLTNASALAYTTLLSMVPLLALIFAVLKGLGAPRLLQPELVSRFALDPQVAADIIGFIDRIQVGTIGFVGAAALLATVVSLLGSIEAAFNGIWRVSESRSVLRKVSDYCSVVFLTPMLLLAAAAITSSLELQQVLEWLRTTEVLGDMVLASQHWFPVLINSFAIGILYAILPNRRPAPVALCLAALLAGGSWQFVQATYLELQFGLARFSAVYGALAQLPFTLVWLYVSWVVVLAGAQIAAVYEFGIDNVEWEGAVSESAVALQILLRLAAAFEQGGDPVEVQQLGREIGVRPEVMGRVAAALREQGWIAAVEGANNRYVLSRAADQIRLGPLSVSQAGAVPDGCDHEVHRILAEVTARQREIWEDRTLASLRVVTQNGD